MWWPLKLEHCSIAPSLHIRALKQIKSAPPSAGCASDSPEGTTVQPPDVAKQVTGTVKLRDVILTTQIYRPSSSLSVNGMASK